MWFHSVLDSQSKTTNLLLPHLSSPDPSSQMWQKRLMERCGFLERLIKKQADAKCARRTRMLNLALRLCPGSGPTEGLFSDQQDPKGSSCRVTGCFPGLLYQECSTWYCVQSTVSSHRSATSKLNDLRARQLILWVSVAHGQKEATPALLVPHFAD